MIDEAQFSISNRMIIAEARQRNWKVESITQDELIVLTTDKGQSALLSITNSQFVSSLGRTIATKKHWSYALCDRADVPTPKTIVYSGDMQQAASFMEANKRVVVKPVDAAHGNGVTTNITDQAALKQAIDYAAQFSEDTGILIQSQVTGEDIRILFIGDTYVGSLIRHPASVVGDGSSTIAQLIATENAREERGLNYQKDLNEINVVAAENYLGDDMQRVPEQDERVQVIGGANVGLGGTSEEVSDRIHPDYIALAKKAKDACLLTHAGVDFMVDDLTQPPSESNSLNLIEINGGPMLAFHQRPNYGEGKPAIQIYLDWIQDQLDKQSAQAA